MRAHSEEELKEWKVRRKAARKKEQAALEHGLLSYQDRLLEEYRESENKETIVCTLCVFLFTATVFFHYFWLD